MIESEFNLLDEPWIIASDKDGKEVTLSLKDIFLKAHGLLSLSGELPTQDVAVLRLLLGVLHSVFSRVDENGEPFDEDEERYENDALALWKRLWNMKKFPEKVIVEYLENYRDMFFLFDEARPFYQVAGLDKGTKYEAAKLIGDVSESGNKIRLFQSRSGSAKKTLNYAEAARWLLYLNAYDDTSSKPTRDKDRSEKLPSVGAGWLGKLGLVYAVGRNLFETLLLNLVLTNYKDEVWENGFTPWELEAPRTAERVQIPQPGSQAELLTVQSRRILLERNGENVTGFILLGGDFFSKENAFAEQMTLWRHSDKDEVFNPRRHDSSRQLWRDFSALLLEGEKTRVPGIVKWLEKLERRRIIPSGLVKFRASSVQYGDKDFFVNDLLDDSISVNAKLLEYLGKEDEWIVRISDALALTVSFVDVAGTLAADLAEASGESYNNSEGSKRRKMAYKDKAKETAYFNLDVPFRNWLSSVDPETDDETKKIEEWLEEAERIIRNLAERMFADTGVVAFSGKKGINGMTSPMAMKEFNLAILKIKKGGTTK